MLNIFRTPQNSEGEFTLEFYLQPDRDWSLAVDMRQRSPHSSEVRDFVSHLRFRDKEGGRGISVVLACVAGHYNRTTKLQLANLQFTIRDRLGAYPAVVHGATEFALPAVRTARNNDSSLVVGYPSQEGYTAKRLIKLGIRTKNLTMAIAE